MCMSPLTIRNNSTYKDSETSPYMYTVPCGKCAECRSFSQNEWFTRLSFELDSLYKRGGISVFLTFTYNDDFLPVYHDYDANFHFPCFRWSDVTTFLNRLKVACNRAFGPHSYKYFVTSEYGSNTQRPHYHGQFNLESHVDLFTFCEICRDCWTYGFMFPKYDAKKGYYVDNFGRYVTPEVTSRTGSVKYVSKYITKDIAYMRNEEVAHYISDKLHYNKMRKCFPKHWQSNHFGITVFDSINLYDLPSHLEKGVINPLTFEYSPLPRFVLDKLKYKNVSTKGKSYERIGSTGKVLYDRELTTFGRDILRYEFRQKVKSQNLRFMKFFQSHDCRDYPIDLESVGVDIYNEDSFTNLSLYYVLGRNLSDNILHRLNYFGRGYRDFSFKAFEDLYVNIHDIDYMRRYADGKIDSCTFERHYSLKMFDLIISAWSFISRLERQAEFAERERKRVAAEKLRPLKFKFNSKLC